jgi:amino acid transporter
VTAETNRTMFLTAATLNWLIGLALLFDAPLVFRLFRVTPAPTELLFVQLFSWLVVVFGVGYFWVSRDPQGNIPIIKLGMFGKASVFLVCIAAVVTGTVSWQMMILASVDLVYAILFWRALQMLR